jgi:hypothetical protein
MAVLQFVELYILGGIVVEFVGWLGGGRSSCEPCGGEGWIMVSHWRRGVTLVRFGSLLDLRWCGVVVLPAVVICGVDLCVW